MDSKELLKRAQEIRVRDHRLKLDLRLRSKEDAVEFIHEEGLVSFLGGNELPSFISATLGRTWKPSRKGFTGWMDWWSVKLSGQPIAKISRDLESRRDILATRLFRRTKTLISNKIWPTLNPIIKRHKELVEKGKIFSELERSLALTIEKEGSIRTDRLRKKLNLTAKESNSRFHRALANLESHSLIVGFEDPHPETHLHANIWQTWEKRTWDPTQKRRDSYEGALEALLETTIRACVIAQENEVTRWFPWGKQMKPITDKLVEKGRLTRRGEYLISPFVNQ